jgi:hypothetical protein
VSTDSDGPRGSSGPRANAVPAAEFTQLSTVDARVSDALLDVLEDAGIAARVEPSVGDVGAYRDTRPHPLPKDTLYVDASRRAEAETVVGAELPGMLAELAPHKPKWTDVDEAFASIIAGFEADDSEMSTTTKPDPVPRLRRKSDDDWETRVAANQAAFDEQDHFVPPPPPPLPRLRGPRLWGAAMLAVALLLLVVVPLAGVHSEGQLIAGILLAVAGTGVTVWQMREGHSDESDPDDGAVV